MASLTTVANVKTTQDGIYCGRACYGRAESLWANPFKIGKDGDRDEVIERFRSYFYSRLTMDETFLERTLKLKGKTLLCWCHPERCHCDIIKEYLDGRVSQ